MRIRELNAVDPSFDRDALALIVKVHMAVMCERRGRHHQTGHRRKDRSAPFHGSHTVSRTCYWFVTFGLTGRRLCVNAISYVSSWLGWTMAADRARRAAPPRFRFVSSQAA